MRTVNRIKDMSFIALFLTVIVTACSSNPDFEPYEGHPLNIAVIGEAPDIQEDKVKFSSLPLDVLNGEKLSEYDAVFIMENHLVEASEDQYADVYLNTAIPFFFIGTDHYVPFVEKDLIYNRASDWLPGSSYAAGVLSSQEDDSLYSWEYGLYNDEITDENMEDMYSRIFMTIDEHGP